MSVIERVELSLFGFEVEGLGLPEHGAAGVGNVIARAVEGQTRALLVLSDKGQIEGSVNCGDAVINGTVIGDLVVEHFLELQSNARVSGTIRYEHLQMDVGAAVRGQLIKAEAVAAADSNVVELAMDKMGGAERR